MIQPEELRIGNLVYSHGNVHELDEQNFLLMLENLEYHNFLPIPLTKEWLSKFGFVDNRLYAKGCYGNGIIGIWFDGEKGCYDIAQFEYVHQLQNLYFSLTNKELAI